jgi:hypothetical protein
VAKRIAAGATLWDLHDLGDAYRRLGVVEHDRDWDEQSDDRRREGEVA